MKRLITLCLAAMTLTAAAKQPQPAHLLIGGSGWNRIAVVDKESKQLVWTFDLQSGDECNGVQADSRGNVLYSFKGGARLVTPGGQTVWEYRGESGTEVQFATQIPSGYALAVLGRPARIVELDSKGRVTKEIPFDAPAKNIHGQLRQICPMSDGSYMVPLLSGKKLIRVQRDGTVGAEIPLDGVGPFSCSRLASGNLLVSGGDGHCVLEVTPGGKEVRRIGQHDLPDVVLGYVAQVNPMLDGGMLICNWLGHGSDATQPHLIELDGSGNVVWTLTDTVNIRRVSCVAPLTAQQAKRLLKNK